ncbi:hypothetical protein L1280_002028 [Deinococcus sp. HSC-46F16]|uniref:hypothetical protein n=1 Tax=Deinococcus sp. HSC-46F16 TaxID=2910968 RepID=UPI00209FACEE|nr:hypothetical protein [Deinococcus sp. HSC-46F16]MCP2014876.1 hypothetical protein [Deinococcus sp. HSC-46F16]
MDDAAIIGFVGALLGALVGAAGTYLATVGAARRQGQDRARAVLGAVGAALGSGGAEESRASAEATLRWLGELRALLNTNGPEADQPAQLGLRLSIPNLTQPVWAGLLGADLGYVPPAVYLKLSELDALTAHANGLAAQCLDPALTLWRLLDRLPPDLTPRHLAALPQRAELEAAAQRLTMLLTVLLDLYRQHAAIRHELRPMLPTPRAGTLTPATP